LVVVLLAAVVGIGCGIEQKPSVIVPPVEAGANNVPTFDFSRAVTVGNHSYLSIQIEGMPAGHVDEVLAILNGFEQAYPELKVTGWRVEKQQNSKTTSDYIFGIWVDHEPR
jgi:hypothetical protein